MTREEQAAQVVNRFTFGPTPGMAQAVAAEGWSHWFDRQLDPGSIDDAALESRLAQYPALAMSPAELAARFTSAPAIRRIAESKEALPADPQLAAVDHVLLTRYAEK